MIAFLKRRCSLMHQATFANPLVHVQFQRFTIYTWFNLIALFAILAVAWCSAAHLAHWWSCWRQFNLYAEAGELELGGMGLWEMVRRGRGVSAPFFSALTELSYFIGHLVGICLLYVLLLAAVYKNFLFVDKQKWDHPSSPHIRLLPLSPSQIQFALIDFRFFIISIFTALAFLTLLLSPIIYEYLFPPVFIFGLDVWILMFVSFRFRQLQAPYGQRIWKNPMLRSWVVASLAPMIAPFLTSPMSKLFKTNFTDTLWVLIFIFIHLSLALLLISAWLLKPRLLRQLRDQWS